MALHHLSAAISKRSNPFKYRCGRHGGMDTTRCEGSTDATPDGNGEAGTVLSGSDYTLYGQSCTNMNQCGSESVALTVTSPPYWNAIDYHTHADGNGGDWYREREYAHFGRTFDDYLDKITEAFGEVLRVTIPGGFCAIVVGTILHKRRHYPAPMLITERMTQRLEWEFHQDIVWNKVTGGVKRAGSFIKNPKPGYYYPNIMTEYILVFRKPGDMRRGREQTMRIDDLFKRDIANNVWHVAPVPPRTIDHPCPYPEEMARRLVLLYSQRGETVLDPFLGSGQTAIAALREGRRCIGYDVVPRYLELAQARIESMRSGSERRRAYNLLPNWQKIKAPATGITTLDA